MHRHTHIKQSNEASNLHQDMTLNVGTVGSNITKRNKYNTNRTVCNYNDILSKSNDYKNNLSKEQFKEKENIVRQLGVKKKKRSFVLLASVERSQRSRCSNTR